MAVSQLGYLGLHVSDVSAWGAFAQEVLGMEVVGREEDGASYLRMDDHHYRIILEPNGKDDLGYTGWEVPDEKSLVSLRQRLEASGIEVTPGTAADRERRKVCDLVRLRDPNGVELEIFYGPLLAATPLKPIRPIAGFKAGALGLGHVVLAARDFEGTIAFYTELLGFRVSDYVQMERPGIGRVTLVFFHCNPRHHSLAFSSASLSPKRISHFMIELNSLDDVGAAYYLCQERKIPITMSLGRHTNDQMVSFYMQCPSGFNVEYGWGGRLVDDGAWAVQRYNQASFWGHLRAQG